MKNLLKKISILKKTVIIFRVFRLEPSFFTRFKMVYLYFKDLNGFVNLQHNKNIMMKTEDLFPRIYDKTIETKLDPVYYIQGTWCAKKVFDNKPNHHYDVGSQALMVGIISQFVDTTMVDIRPLSVSLKKLSFVKGDITNLPFKDNSIESLSSICVIEHIGLGRYGDPLDQFGTEKAVKELCRVLAKNGNLYISVPVDSETKVYFNAHRAFTRDYVLSLFKDLFLIEETYIYGNETRENYDSSRGFGTGLYHFRK